MQLTFSEKELYLHFKPFMDADPVNMGKNERDLLIELWKKNEVKMFITELERLSSDQSLWRVKQIDLVYWHEVLNAIDVLLKQTLQKIKGENGEINESEQKDHELDTQKVIKFLKSLVQYASSSIHFNLTPYVLELYYIYSGNPIIREEILTILICITSKIADKKWQHFNKKIEELQKEVKKIVPSVKIMLKSFFMVSQFLLKEEIEPSQQQELGIQLGEKIFEFVQHKCDKKTIDEQVKTRLQQEYSHLQEKIKNCANIRTFFEEYFILILKCVNLYLLYAVNIGNLSPGKSQPSKLQSRKLEKMLPPNETVDKFIQFIKDTRIQKKLQTQVINTFFLFIILDLNSIFDYLDPTQNKYYLQACKNPEFFIQLLQNLAKHHTYDKIQSYSTNPIFKDYQTQIEEQLQVSRSLLNTQNENEEEIMLIDEGNSHMDQCEGIKSQKFLNAYLNFLCQLINIKNKPFQTQLHSQFLKPILAILSVKPINKVYPININCQVKAAKLLKDVIKHANMDESSSVEKVIERIKVEIQNIYDSEANICKNKCGGMGFHEWEKADDDDTENNMLFIYKQEFIRACMRFLCYSVFRNDPNQINFNQNFIANSRKILESGLIQNEIINMIIKPSFQKGEEYMNKIIEPIFLSSIQLISYVFNDLPQKIPQYLENGLLPSIVEALEIKIPLGPEVFSLIMKFLYTICLNPEGAKLVYTSKVINTLMILACESQAYSHLSQNVHKQINYQQQLQQLALISQDISNKIYKALIDNFTVLNKKAWDVTQHYVEMDKSLLQLQLTTTNQEILATKKQQIKQAYEKEQTCLELCYENVTNLLFNFIYAENEQFGDDNMIHRVIKQHPEYCDTLLEVIATPIVASACPNMFRHFIYFTSTILSEFELQFKTDFMGKILAFVKQQVTNIQLLLGTKDLDSLADVNQDIEKNGQIILGELCEDQDKKQLLLDLRGEDQISVTFGKISFYCDIFKYSLSNSTNNNSNKNYELALKLMAFDDYIPVLEQLFKVQALINRYHSAIYERELIKQNERYQYLSQKYPEIASQLQLTQTKADKKTHWNISNEKDELAKLHFQFVTDTVSSLSDVEARLSHKTVIELSLEENISHTSNMCQLAIRRLIIQSLKIVNRQKIHFSQAMEEKVLILNQTMGRAIAEEFKEFTDMDMRSEVRTDANYIMKICCQHSAVFGEFNKVLFPNQISSGYILTGFIQNKGLDHVAHLVKWIIESIRQIEIKYNGKKLIRVDLCKHIQLLWSHVIDFYFQFIEGKYLDSQFHQFMVAFKQNPVDKIKKEETNKEYDISLQNMQKYMYSYNVQVCRFLFQELDQEEGVKQLGFNVFQYFDKYSELFFSTFMDIYQFMCNGFLQCKIFDMNANKQSTQSQQENLLKLVEEMNYPQPQAEKALEQSQNNLQEAINILESVLPFASPDKKDSHEQEDKVKISGVVPSGTILTQDDLLKIIEHTLPTILQFHSTNPKLMSKNKIIESLIFKLGLQKNNENVQHFLDFIKETIFTLLTEAVDKKDASNIGVLANTFECLLRYKRGQLLDSLSIYKHLILVNDIFKMLIADLKQHASVPTDQVVDMAQARTTLSEMTVQVNMCLSLYLFLAEEIKTISDIKKLDNILAAGSSLVEPVSGISEDLKEVHDMNRQNIFINDSEQLGSLLQQITLSVIDLFQSLHNMNIDFEPDKDYALYQIVFNAIVLLNFLVNIKDYGDFDCHQLVLKNNGLNSLFEIKCLMKSFEFQRNPTDRRFQQKIDAITVQSKILLQQLCSNDQSQIRIYESLIKSILFINFQERYKREEGQDVKKILINEEMKQQIKLQQSSKKKKMQTPMKRSKSEDRNQDIAEPSSKQQQHQEPSGRESNAFAKQQSKTIKQILQKIEYGDTQLSDFLSFFNNIMQIQDLKSFLQACQNACIIKRKKVNDHDKKDDGKVVEKIFIVGGETISEEVKELDKNKGSKKKTLGKKSKKHQQPIDKEEPAKKVEEKTEEKLFICLNSSSLKEMLNNILMLEVPENVEVKKEQQNQNNKHQMQKFQQEIIFNLLDKIIDQIRDQQIMILSICKNTQNPTPQGIKLTLLPDQQLQVTLSEGTKANKYLFDCICLISHLTYIITHTPNLVSALLKHNKGKTFKFLIRNIYFLLALKSIQDDQVNLNQETQQNEITVTLQFSDEQLDKKCKETIIEFFKRVMFDNPHQTVYDRKLKAEARQIFIKESLKNLCDTNPNKYPQWPILRVVINVGAVWIVSGILTEEDGQALNQDKKIEALVQSTQRFRNVLRSNMTKQLIFEGQQLIKQENSYHTSFNLMKHLERVQKEIQQYPEFFGTLKESIEYCMNCVLCFLKPFENNQALWGEKSIMKKGDIDETSLGFQIQRDDQSIIDENDDEEEDDNEESHSSSEDEEDDDELLQSERLGDDPGFGERDDMDEYGSEGEEDEEDDDEDQGLDSSDSMNEDSSDEEDGGGPILNRHRSRHNNDDNININEESDMQDLADMDIDDYGVEDYMNGEEDEEDEYIDQLLDEDLQRLGYGNNDINSNLEAEDNRNNDHPEEEKDDGENEDEEDSEGEDMYSDGYYDESDSALESQSHPSFEDGSYDSEIEGNQMEIEIMMGRQQMDGESVQNAGNNGGRAQRRGVADAINLNNISMDMFNMNMGAYGGGDDEESKDGDQSQSIDVSESQNRGREGHNHRHPAVPLSSDPSQQINQISGILGNIITMMRQAPQYFTQQSLDSNIQQLTDQLGIKGTKPSQMPQGIEASLHDVLHNPSILLKEIFTVNKKMQSSEDLFKMYIKEQVAQPVGISPQAPVNQQKPNEAIPDNTNGNKDQKRGDNNNEIETSTKSQFSTRNPFENNQFQQRDTPLFQIQPAQRSNAHNTVQIETSSQQMRQDLNDLDGLDPEFIENLGTEGLQNIIDTDNVINNIVNQGTNQPQNITNITQLIDNCATREQRNAMFMSMDESLLNQLPPQMYSEALVVRRMANESNRNNLFDSIRSAVGGAAGPVLNANNPVFTILRRGGQALNANSFLGVGRNRSGSNQHGEVRPGEIGRNRFMSFDSQINGLADFSRNNNDPFFRHNRIQQTPLNQVSLRQNTLFSNVVNFMNDELTEMNNSPFIDPQKCLDLDKFCVQLLQQSFSFEHSQEHDQNQSSLIEQNYMQNHFSKVQGLVEMTALWYKCGFLEEGVILNNFEKLLKIVIRVQGVRYGAIVEMVRWMKQKMNSFYVYVKQNLDDRESKFYLNSNQKAFMIKFLFNKNEYLMLINFVLLCVKSVRSLESFINQTGLQGSLDILKPPNQNASLNAIFEAITNPDYMTETKVMASNQTSMLEYILDELIVFANILDKHQEYVIDNQLLTTKEGQSKDKFYEDLFQALSQIVKYISNGTWDKEKDSPLFDKVLLGKLGDLVVFQRQNLTKKALKFVKIIFVKLSQYDVIQRQLVLQYFRSHLSSYLQSFIQMLRPETHFQKLSDIQNVAAQIMQLLKISKEDSKNGGEEANICDQEFYFQLIDSVSLLIEEKSVGLPRGSSVGLERGSSLQAINTSSVATVTSTNTNNMSFIFKEEFRTIMMVLFVLIEYNLKFIFNQHTVIEQQTQKVSKKKIPESKQASKKNDKDKKKEAEEEKGPAIEFQTVEEMQLEILEGNRQSKKDRIDLLDAIDQHLKLKIKDERIREDSRLKMLIKFCLEHKKVINSFIRANQQVLNESLRNVVIQVPQILDFDNKRLLFRSEIKKLKRKYRLQYIQLSVRRDSVFADSFEQMRSLSLDKWKGKMSVEFADEAGIDEGGLTKEWFVLLSKGIFNPDLGLFTQSSTGAGSSYYPNTNSGAIHGIDHIDYFTFIGKIVGKALLEQQLLDAYFVRALYKIILGQKLTYHDVEDFDNELYKNLKWCLDNSTNGIGLTFTETHTYFDVNTDIELIPGGKDIEVTDENKFEYVQKKAQYKLYQQIQKQADAFLKGFYGVVPKDLIQIFDSKELELLISGLPTIDVEDLKENTEYQNYTSQSEVVKWLWEVLEEFDNSERAEFIQFVTGSSKVPVEGFKGLRGARGIQKFQIVKVFSNDLNRLPQAHTCFKQLELPNYTSKEMLKERLLMAITEGKTFGFA